MNSRTRELDAPQTSIARRFRNSIRGLGWTAALATTLFSTACSRPRYRSLTDNEAYYLLDEKVGQSAEENTETYRIEIDPRSRMFDPFNPDRPPMPEDDPQSNNFMRLVDRKKGYPLWEANGRTNTTENPGWWEQLPLDERGVLVLNLEDAVRTALIHSPDYQRNLEEMYLSALDVSSERFLLDSQFYGGWRGNFSASEGGADKQFTSSTNNRPRGTGLFMNKRFASGTDLLVGFANSITWQLAGPGDSITNTSLLDFALIQPLLRQGGRDVVLERLTLAERVLLANVRAFERYRRGFYLEIATGQNNTTSPQRRGGAFGGAGLGGFDVLGSVFTNAGGGGGGGGAGAAVPTAGGYLGLLQDQINIANQQENIIRLQDLYLQLQDNYRELLLTMPLSQTEIPQQQLQVAQAQQDLYSNQTTLLGSQTAYQASLDQFKAQLGLPPYLCVEIRGNLLDQFKLISQSLRDRRTEISSYRAAIGESNSALLSITTTERDPVTGEAFRTVAASEDLVEGLSTLQRQLAPMGAIIETVLEQDVAEVRADIDQLRKNVPVRRSQLDRLKQIAESERGMVCSLLPLGDFNTSFLDGEGLETLPDELTTDLERLITQVEDRAEDFTRVMSSIETILGNINEFEDGKTRFREIADSVLLGSQDLIALLNESVLAIQLVQGRARTEAALLPEIEIDPRTALEIARANRRDWLNNRANLVNTWRQIEVVADDLESFLDLEIRGSVGNSGLNPLAFDGSTSRINARLAWDAPITRLQERNNYRQILIQYQRAKRSYYQFEDGVWATLRARLRQVLQNKLNFEIQRFAVRNAALQISINADIRQINETLGQTQGPTAARDAVQGLSSFLNSQTLLIGIFVNYEALRRGLDLDLGTMEVDAEGLWIDPGPIRPDTVGGGLGDAILQYGLTENELLMREEIRTLDAQPIEIAPSDLLPPSAPNELPENPVIGNPAAVPNMQDGAFNAQQLKNGPQASPPNGVNPLGLPPSVATASALGPIGGFDNPQTGSRR